MMLIVYVGAELEGWKPAGMGIHQVLCDAQYTEDESGKVTSAAYGMDLKSDEGKVLAWTHGPSEPMYQGVRVHEIVAALMGVTLSDEVRKLHLKYKLSDEEKKLFDIKHLEIVSDNEEAIEMMEEMRDEDSDISKQLDSRSGRVTSWQIRWEGGKLCLALQRLLEILAFIYQASCILNFET